MCCKYLPLIVNNNNNNFIRAAAIVNEGKLDWLNSIHARRLFQDDNRMKCFVDDLREELLSRESFK